MGSFLDICTIAIWGYAVYAWWGIWTDRRIWRVPHNTGPGTYTPAPKPQEPAA